MRVLVATATAGGGHLAAAAALEEAWRAFRPEDVVEQLDLVKFFSPLHRKVHADGYVKVVTHAPELWGLMFHQTDHPERTRRLARLRLLFPSHSRTRFERFVRQFEPDVALCTHYLPLETLRLLREKNRRDDKPLGAWPAPLVVSVVTDFEAHALWMDPCVDMYCVAADETRARLVARGVPAEAILAAGIPIASRFSAKVDTQAARRTLGLRDDVPVILVLSGGSGMGPVAEVVRELDKTQRPFQTVVVTGKNPKLRRELATQDYQHPTRVLGFASNMHELVAVADLIVSKPGGLTTAELLARGKPLFIVNPIPGQEAANSDFLLEHGAAAKVNRAEDLPYRLEQLLGSKKLAAMTRAASELGRPQAAREVCEAVAGRVSREQSAEVVRR
jgi:processive 1,2-diacylglycerol beta-glucosyltransferase